MIDQAGIGDARDEREIALVGKLRFLHIVRDVRELAEVQVSSGQGEIGFI